MDPSIRLKLEGPASTARLRIALGFVALGISAAVHHFALERETLLRFSGLSPGDHKVQELAALAIAKTVLLLCPALLACWSRGSHRTTWVRAGLLSVGYTLLVLDQSIFASVGRHLVDLLPFLTAENGADAAGRPSLWLGAILRCSALGTLLGVATHVAATLAEAVIRKRTQASPARTWIGFASTLGALAYSFSLHTQPTRLGEGTEERLYDAFAFDLRMRFAAAPSDQGSVEGALRTQLESSYRSHFARLRRPPPLAPVPQERPSSRPPIVLLAIESLRRDALTTEQMPKLTGWARDNAHVFLAHEAATHSSEAGLFSLFYGRSHLLYHQTLDAKQGPTLLRWLKAFGYETGYFSGQPVKWLRQEEFISADQFDHFSHNDQGDWPDWDKRALADLAAWTLATGAPRFAFSFLMSSHFEYQYPKEYEKHTPVASSKFKSTDVLALSADDKIPHLNRYKNTLGFLDDLVYRTIEALPKDAVIIVTGDHGESFFDGGMFGHGYAFNDAVINVPLFIRFPESDFAPDDLRSPATVSETSLHQDVLPLLVRYLLGGDHMDSVLSGSSRPEELKRRTVLSAYQRPTGRVCDALLSVVQGNVKHRARLSLNQDEPALGFFGFYDAKGLPIETPALTASHQAELADEFSKALSKALR